MTVTTVRPSATPAAVGFSVTGAASVHAALADDLDASFVKKTGTGVASAIVGASAVTLSTGQAVRRVRVRGRASGPDATAKANLQLGVRLAGVNYFTPATALVRGAAAAATVTSAWFTSAPDGAAWDQKRLNALLAQVTDFRDGASASSLFEVYVDVDVTTAPTVAVTAPSGTLTGTGQPDVTWTYADADGEAEAFYQVRIFDVATYSAAAFDPLTGVPVWDSGEVASSDLSTTVAAPLANGTYRAYVRAAKTINGAPLWSSYAFSGFVVNVTPPTAPTIAATPSPSTATVSVVVTGAAPTGFDSQVFRLQRSDDDGTTWKDTRYGSAITPGAGNVSTLVDYEAPRGIPIRYRARAIGYAGTDVRASAWVATPAVVLDNDGQWWFTPIGRESLTVGGVRVKAGPETSQEARAGVFATVGRPKSVVVEGELGGEDGSYEIVTSSAAQWQVLKGALQSQATILVQDPFGDQKYVRITSRSWTVEGGIDAPRRYVKIDYVEVSAAGGWTGPELVTPLVEDAADVGTFLVNGLFVGDDPTDDGTFVST